MSRHHEHTEFVFARALVSFEIERLCDALERELKRYNPNQPRASRGTPTGGQWVGYNGTPPFGFEANPVSEPTGATDPQAFEDMLVAAGIVVAVVFGRGAVVIWRGAMLARRTQWVLGKHKSALKWKNRVEAGKWTAKEITDTIRYGERSKAVNKVNKGNRAVQYTDRETGKYVVRDEVTKEILQVSRPGYLFKPKVQ